MRHGFVKVASATTDIRVADVAFNTQKICEALNEAVENGAKIVVFPELCITGDTCGDLFYQDTLINSARKALHIVAEETRGKDTLVFVGVPLEAEGKLYNVAAVLNQGEIIGFVTKTFLPNYSECYEMRQFQPGPKKAKWLMFEGKKVPFGPQILFQSADMPKLIVSAEIGADVWAVIPPSVLAATCGANVIVNCSASSEQVGISEKRRRLIASHSQRLMAGYVYTNAGEGESTTDLVFGGHNIIAENGVILKENGYQNGIIYSEIDIECLNSERRRNTTFQRTDAQEMGVICVPFELQVSDTVLTRVIAKNPFVAEDKTLLKENCEEALMIQALGLKKRLEHARIKSAVVGISGGLDSTLALLVTAKAFDMLGMGRSQIIAVTMPCFGTTDRTYRNACRMTEKLGARLIEVPIKEAVLQHFEDIGHDVENHDVTYENAQARERTQVLMDIANRFGGIVIGTGDMSELALGWATYNGDHMSMYGVNASVPKTQVRYLVRYYADTCQDEELKKVLIDVIETPVSPELLPPKDGEIAQKTEDLVGPYELHDFYMYYVLRYGFEPDKIFHLAKRAFEEEYDTETILKWLETFYRRFFSQQFKRSCMPDGPKVSLVGLSPRGDLKMPSDACAAMWMKDLEEIKESD